MRVFCLLFVLMVALSSCNKKFKETVGVLTPGPDEYQVQRGKSLEVPPHYYLPTPESTTTQSSGVSGLNLNDGEQAFMREIQE